MEARCQKYSILGFFWCTKPVVSWVWMSPIIYCHLLVLDHIAVHSIRCGLSVCVSVRYKPWALQRWLNWFMWHLEWGLGGSRNHVLGGVLIPTREGQCGRVMWSDASISVATCYSFFCHIYRWCYIPAACCNTLIFLFELFKNFWVKMWSFEEKCMYVCNL